MSFPLSPSNNQTAVLNGQTYIYSSSNLSWTRIVQYVTATTSLLVTGNTQATATNTGALQVIGGTGIGGNLWVGGTIYGSIAGPVLGTITSATNISGGTAGQLLYQSATNITAFVSTGTLGNVLVSNGTNAPTYNNTLTLTGTTASVSTNTGALQVVGGVGVGGDLYLSGTITQVGGTHATLATTYNLINTTATTVNFAGAATTIIMGASNNGTTTVRNNLVVSGNLTIQGTTTIVDSTVTNIADPIITLGGGAGNAAPTADDNKDRGVAFKWVNNSGSTSTGFFGYKDTTGYFTYITTATITGEVVSGTKGAMDVNLAGGTAMSIVYQSSPDNTAFLAASTSGYILQTNGTGSPPTWVSASGVSAGSATYADNVRTVQQTGNASYYPTFVSANNASNAYMPVYTTASFVINPMTGNVGISTTTPNSRLDIRFAALTTSTQLNHILLQSLADGASNALGARTGITFNNRTVDYTSSGGLSTSGIYGINADPATYVYGRAMGLVFYTSAMDAAATEKLRITSNGGVSFGTSGTAYGTAGQILQSNGDAAPTWVPVSSATVGTSTQVQTVATITNASHYLTFVDSNNASATAETVYTTSSFVVNPSTRFVGIGTSVPSSKFHVLGAGTTSLPSKRGGGFTSVYIENNTAATDAYLEIANTATNSMGLLFSKGSASGPYGLINYNNSTDVMSLYTSATIAMYIDGSQNILIGTASQLNTGFTNRLNVSGSIVAGNASSTNGSILMQGQYGTGAITVLGTEYSSGGPVLSYGVYPSTAGTGAFFSSSGLALTRAAYTQAGNSHQWYVGASQTVAIGSAVTMTNPMILNASGLQAVSLGIGTAPSGTTGEIRATNEITAYYSSDRRLKENIHVISNPISIVEQIRGVRFDWTDEHMQSRGGEDGYFVRKHDIGVIAQEVEAVLPEIVATREDGTKVVKYEKLVALLIEAVKDQQQQINQISQALQNLANK